MINTCLAYSCINNFMSYKNNALGITPQKYTEFSIKQIFWRYSFCFLPFFKHSPGIFSPPKETESQNLVENYSFKANDRVPIL